MLRATHLAHPAPRAPPFAPLPVDPCIHLQLGEVFLGLGKAGFSAPERMLWLLITFPPVVLSYGWLYGYL